MDYIFPGYEGLRIEYLGHLFDNTSECYKLFWFQAIVDKILAGRTDATYEELIDEMIADAWYMVTEYHLNLGPRDNLEFAVNRLKELSGLRSSEDKTKVLTYIENSADPSLRGYKIKLTNNVPYRLQAPFLDFKTEDWDGSKKGLVERINSYKSLIYRFDNVQGLGTRIVFDEKWCDYIRRNQLIIKGWINYNLVDYLQRRNPNVPGVIDKLSPPTERKLEDIKKYWKMIMEVEPVVEIYSDNKLTAEDISIDHFVPWSYVANDEIWNLHPTTRSINSSKSNNLPRWEVYFNKLSAREYLSYTAAMKYPAIKAEFEKCKRKHLNSESVEGRLYAPDLKASDFAARLSEIVLPVYQSAKAAGFKEWSYGE